MSRRWAGVALLVAGVAAGAAGAAAAGDQDTRPRGQALYQDTCATCHGPNGEGGKGPILAVPTLPRAQTDDLLFKVIRDGISGTLMPPSALTDDELRQVVAWVRRLGKLKASSTAKEPIPGDARRGEQIYRTTGGCEQCHSIRGRGGALGPDLTSIGYRRNPEHLRTSLITPEAEVPRNAYPYRSEINIPSNFLQVRVQKRTGERLAGVRVNEDTFSIQVRDLSGQIHSLLKSELAELQKEAGVTPMPSYRTLPAQDLDDLVAFLASLRGL